MNEQSWLINKLNRIMDYALPIFGVFAMCVMGPLVLLAMLLLILGVIGTG